MELVDDSELPNFRDLDFDAWADGNTWRATRGKDFHGTTEGFNAALRRYAKRNGYRVSASRNTDTVTFRITPHG